MPKLPPELEKKFDDQFLIRQGSFGVKMGKVYIDYECEPEKVLTITRGTPDQLKSFLASAIEEAKREERERIFSDVQDAMSGWEQGDIIYVLEVVDPTFKNARMVDATEEPYL